MPYDYKTVELPANLFTKKGTAVAATTLQTVIDTHANEGFEFYRVDRFSVERPAGCLGMGGTQTTTYNVVTFRRPK